MDKQNDDYISLVLVGPEGALDGIRRAPEPFDIPDRVLMTLDNNHPSDSRRRVAEYEIVGVLEAFPIPGGDVIPVNVLYNRLCVRVASPSDSLGWG